MELSVKLLIIKPNNSNFYNSHFGGYGCQGYYVETEPKEKYDSNICYIGDEEYYAEEARFGGIVIQKKE